MGNIVDDEVNFGRDAYDHVHMPHWMTHGREPHSWACCAWVQLGGGSSDECQECGSVTCPEAKAYREKHYQTLVDREAARRREAYGLGKPKSS